MFCWVAEVHPYSWIHNLFYKRLKVCLSIAHLSYYQFREVLEILHKHSGKWILVHKGLHFCKTDRRQKWNPWLPGSVCLQLHWIRPDRFSKVAPSAHLPSSVWSSSTVFLLFHRPTDTWYYQTCNFLPVWWWLCSNISMWVSFVFF